MKSIRFMLGSVVGLGLLAGGVHAASLGYGPLVLVGAILLAGLLVFFAFLRRGNDARQEEYEEARAAAKRNNPTNRAPVVVAYDRARSSRDKRLIVDTLNLISREWGQACPEYVDLQRYYASMFSTLAPLPSHDPNLIKTLYGHILGNDESGQDFPLSE